MQVRPMKMSDCEQVAAIEAVSFSVPWSLNAFTETLEMDNYRYFVAEEEGEILGYCGFSFVLDEAEIPNVCVKESARRQGVGRQMMDVLVKEASAMGISRLLLEVRVSNHGARILYESLGFTVDGIRRNFYEKPVENAFLMSMTL